MRRLSLTVTVVLLMSLLACSLAQALPLKPWQVKGATAGQTITGPDGGKLVWVPAGQFAMGMEFVGRYMFYCGPVHKVIITRGLWLGKLEVTNGQYRRFCTATGRTFPVSSTQGDSNPVEFVSWPDALAYCQHFGLRLPTEAEWEWAARGPAGRIWPWGNTWDSARCCNMANHVNGPHRTRPVGSFPGGVSWCGAMDLAGNVWEWCGDWLGKQYYASSPANDPAGPSSGAMRVIRGGSWDAPADICRSANRNGSLPTSKSMGIGFRCVIRP
jgi:formylglycine-generating enzyme required for sulfatase activity